MERDALYHCSRRHWELKEGQVRKQNKFNKTCGLMFAYF